MPSNYGAIMALLTEAEKKRIFCMWMNSDVSNVNWEQATEDFGGSGNITTFKKRNTETTKKVKDAIAKAAAGGEPITTEDSEGNGGTKKRKAAGGASKAKKAKGEVKVEAEADDEDGAGDLF